MPPVYIPNTNVEDATNILTINSSYTDLAGNNGSSLSTSNFTIDTKAPTASISYSSIAPYKENDVVLYVDGVLQISDTSASIPTCDKLTICGFFPTSNNTTQRLSKHNQVLLFKTRLSNEELAALTTI